MAGTPPRRGAARPARRSRIVGGFKNPATSRALTTPCAGGPEQPGVHPPVKPRAPAGEVRAEEREAEQTDADDPERVGGGPGVEAAEQSLQPFGGDALHRGLAAHEHLHVKQRLVLQHLRGDLLALRSLLHDIRRRLTTNLPATASQHIEHPAARVGDGRVIAAGLSEQPASEPSPCPGGAWQKIDRDLRPLARGVKAGERACEALERVGVEREVRKRLAARLREAKLGAHHTPVLSSAWARGRRGGPVPGRSC